MCGGWGGALVPTGEEDVVGQWVAGGASSMFITIARKYFWLCDNVSVVINNFICYLAAILVFSFCT